MKNRLAVLVSVLAIFAFAGISSAATVDVTVGVPYIQKGVCDQVGNMALEWDDGATFTVGDQIQIGLVGQPTFCKPVNMLVSVSDAAGDASGFTGNTDLTQSNATVPLSETLGGGALTANDGGVAFQVQASSGGDTLLITVVADTNSDGTFGLEGTGSITFTANTGGGDDANELQLRLFNEKTYDITTDGQPTIRKINVSSGAVTNAKIDAEDNTLCVNTGENYASNYVGVGISAEDAGGIKLWDFNPASPNIAIIKSGQTVSLYDCPKSVPGTIELCTAGTAGQDGTAGTSALPVINENGTGVPGGVEGTNTGPNSDEDGYSDAAADAYMDETHRNNNMVFQTSDGEPFDNANYSVELEIKVAPKGSSSSDDALSGDYGFYFKDGTVKTDGYASASSSDYADKLTSACAVADGEAAETPTTEIYDASGTKVTAQTLNNSASSCEWDTDADKITKIIIPSAAIASYGVNTLTDGYMLVDLPDIVYDPSRATAGMQVYVFAKLIKKPCDLEAEGTLLVGTVYDESTASTTGSATDFAFPYFAEVGANGMTSQFYNGFTLANASTSATEDGTASLTIYEADGDIFTVDVTVAPGAVNAFLLSTLSPTLSSSSTGDGVFGGQRCWVFVSCDFTAYGSAMITNKTGGGVMSYVVGNNSGDN